MGLVQGGSEEKRKLGESGRPSVHTHREEHVQARERGLWRNAACPHRDLGRLASGTEGRHPLLAKPPSVASRYGSPGKLPCLPVSTG